MLKHRTLPQSTIMFHPRIAFCHFVYDENTEANDFINGLSKVKPKTKRIKTRPQKRKINIILIVKIPLTS